MNVRRGLSKVADSGGWESFATALDFHNNPKTTQSAPEVEKKRARLSLEAEPAGLAVGGRLNEVQGQLISANERIHALESFAKEQEAWLDQERLDHAETWHLLQQANKCLSEERSLHQIQNGIIPALQEQIQMANRDADERVTRESLRLSMDFQQALAKATAQLKQDMDERLSQETARIQQEAEDALAQQASQHTMSLEMAWQRADEIEKDLSSRLVKEEAACKLLYEKLVHAQRMADAAEEGSRLLRKEVAERGNTIEDLEEKVTNLREELSETEATATSVEKALEEHVGILGEELAQSKTNLRLAQEQLHEACVEVSRMAELLAEKKETTESRDALLSVIRIACKLGDLQADAPALTKHINYAAWRTAVSALEGTSGAIDPTVVGGAATVIGTLVPILYSLYCEVGQHNEKLAHEYEAVAAHCKEVEAACKCKELKDYIAQIEKEMSDAEALINKQNSVNKDLHTRVSHRNALDYVKIDGASLLQSMVTAQDQRRQLELQVQNLERSLASARTTSEKLQRENGKLSAKLLEAEQKIPPPRALLHIRDLSENVEELRRSLGPLGEDITCTQCTLYLGRAREEERKRNLAEQSVVEEQRRLVKMTQDLAAKTKDIENTANEKVAEEKKRLTRVERKLAEAETKLEETSKASKAELESHRTTAERRLAAKNELISKLESEKTIASRELAVQTKLVAELQTEIPPARVARYALRVMAHLLATHRFRTMPPAERVRTAHDELIRVNNSHQAPAELAIAYRRLEGELKSFAEWMKTDKTVEDMARERTMLVNYVEGLKKHHATFETMQLSREGEEAVGILWAAWKYACNALSV